MPPLPQVKNVVAVAGGKGGVGKSTVSANLALALSKSGLRVGLMDADVYGPSIPTILGVSGKPVMENEKIKPVERFGLKIISTGFFLPAHEAVIWRGPMLHKMIQDLLSRVDWGGLDYLLVDLPPGTGDVQISLCQTVPLTGALIVSTPQEVAWQVAQKAIVMFDKLNVPVLGILENMSGDVFGRGGARRLAERLGIPFVGEIPLEPGIRRTADEGDPIVHSDPAHASSAAFLDVAKKLTEQVERLRAAGPKKPSPLKWSGAGSDRVEIEWSDEKKSSFSPRELRLACPCAACVNEITGRKMLDHARVPESVRVAAFYPVGRYALQIAFSDGHNTGLYGFDYLRQLAYG